MTGDATTVFAKHRLTIWVVYVRLHLNFSAISLSGNISRARSVTWSAMSAARLCSATKWQKHNLRSRSRAAGILAFRLEVCCYLGALQLPLIEFTFQILAHIVNPRTIIQRNQGRHQVPEQPLNWSGGTVAASQSNRVTQARWLTWKPVYCPLTLGKHSRISHTIQLGITLLTLVVASPESRHFSLK